MASKNAQNLVLPERNKELLPNVLFAISCLLNQENIWTIQDDQESKSYSLGVAFLISICEQTLYLYFYQCDTCYWWYIVAWFRLLLHDAIKILVDFSHPTGKISLPILQYHYGGALCNSVLVVWDQTETLYPQLPVDECWIRKVEQQGGSRVSTRTDIRRSSKKPLWRKEKSSSKHQSSVLGRLHKTLQNAIYLLFNVLFIL